MERIALIISLLVLTTACQKENKNNFVELFADRQKADVQKCPFDMADDVLWAPKEFVADGDNFIFVEEKLDTLLCVYNAPTQSVRRILHRGQGPDEYVVLSSVVAASDGFYAMDFNSRKSNYFDYATLTPTKDSMYLSVADTLPVSFASIGDSVRIYEVGGRDLLFYMFENKRFVSAFGDLSPYYADAESASEGVMGNFVNSEKNKRLAWASFTSDLMEIYDYSAPGSVRRVAAHRGEALQTEDGVIMGDAFMSVISLAASDDYIYALYSGKSLMDVIRETPNMEMIQLAIRKCGYILVFDWDGNPVRCLTLDNDALYISYDHKTGKLYCLCFDNDGNYVLRLIANI